MFRWTWMAMLSLILAWPVSAAGPELQIKSLKPEALVKVDRLIGDDKALLSVADAEKQPVLGLGGSEFAVTRGGKPAKIVSVQPIAESLDVPRHIVLVLDNSNSMRHRDAVAPLLDGVTELLKIVRSIDQVQMVVFDDRKTVTMGGRDLHVRTFKSNDPAELKAFVAQVYRDGMTSSTVLYEGMLAGLELIRAMPADEPKFLVVFSDGEDLNSAFKREDVNKAAAAQGGFDAYAIDYLPGEVSDPFLAAFASQNRGQLWKATSETNLVPIFQSVASKMQYYYVVNYLFPPVGSLKVLPAKLTIDELKAVELPAPPDQGDNDAATATPRITSLVSAIDASVLTLQPVIDTAYGIARWSVAVSNAGGKLAEQAGEGAPAGELQIPLPTEEMVALATGGDLQVSMTLEDRKGQQLVLAAPPVKLEVFRTTGSLTVSPAALTIEEVKTIDASPMLGHIYFANGSSEIPAQYVRIADPATAAAFAEQHFRDPLAKYYQVLNIIGKRLVEHPEATVTLVGCNDNRGSEKGNKKLSAQRAEAVSAYLQNAWQIAPERLRIEARNLPEQPSSSRLEEGREENRRVEIRSGHPAILEVIRSTYLATRIDVNSLTLKPSIVTARGLARWKIALANAAGTLVDLAGEETPAKESVVPLPTGDLNGLAAGGDIQVTMEVQDRNGRSLLLTAKPVPVKFVQTSQRLAQKQDYLVQEKYALILFDFDSDSIDDRNREIVNTIVARIKELPQATVEVVGHTDNIGKEDYNAKLSERRALAVYQLLAAAYGSDPGERIRHRGVGSREPLYDNTTPEARAFNRTVTITVEYLTGDQP